MHAPERGYLKDIARAAGDIFADLPPSEARGRDMQCIFTERSEVNIPNIHLRCVHFYYIPSSVRFLTKHKQNNHTPCYKLLLLSRERARGDTKLLQTVSEISVLVPHTVSNILTHFLLQ